MKLDELMELIIGIANKNHISKPYIVGGVVRDQIINKLNKVDESVKDFDLCNGDKSILLLGKKLSEALPNSFFNVYDDGHSSLEVSGLKLDFSNNFVIPNIKVELEKMGVKDITPLKLELYSRDFLFNTLLETLDFKNIYDLTGQGINDIEAKLIRCPINPEITIGYDARRILRAIKFAVKFGFNIDEKLKAAMVNNREKIKSLPIKWVQDKIAEIIRIDPDRGVEELVEYKILSLVPTTKEVSDILIQKRKLLKTWE